MSRQTLHCGHPMGGNLMYVYLCYATLLGGARADAKKRPVLKADAGCVDMVAFAAYRVCRVRA